LLFWFQSDLHSVSFRLRQAANSSSKSSQGLRGPCRYLRSSPSCLDRSWPLRCPDGPPNQFNLVSPWSIFVTIGASIGITMFFVVFFLFTPTANSLVRVIKQMQQNPQQPPPAEFKILQKRLAVIPPLGVTLLLLAEVFMVAAAQF